MVIASTAPEAAAGGGEPRATHARVRVVAAAASEAAGECRELRRKEEASATENEVRLAPMPTLFEEDDDDEGCDGWLAVWGAVTGEHRRVEGLDGARHVLRFPRRGQQALLLLPPRQKRGQTPWGVSITQQQHQQQQ